MLYIRKVLRSRAQLTLLADSALISIPCTDNSAGLKGRVCGRAATSVFGNHRCHRRIRGSSTAKKREGEHARKTEKRERERERERARESVEVRSAPPTLTRQFSWSRGASSRR